MLSAIATRKMMRIPATGTKTSVKTTKKIMSLLFLIVTISVITTNIIVPVDAEISCLSTQECEDKLQVGSECVGGFCSNPFVEGCFKTMLGSLSDEELAERNIPRELSGALDGRVCNSDDDDEDGSTFCLANEFDYFEIRIHNADWEASIFVAWIMQIMLMEVLKVPVTVGLNSGLTNISSFYSPRNTLEYSQHTYVWDAFPGEGVDCGTTDEDCVDIMPEVWNGQVDKWINMLQQGTIEPVDGCGQVGKMGWFIPGATAQRDDTLVSYYGLQGEENRAKLAQAFKRPTTWYEYCEEVSVDNCTTPDNVTKHYPETESEAAKYFQEGQYTGYFRMLPENDCTAFPDTCTGYIVGPICEWSTNVEAQLYWNNIVGLKPDGYTEPNKGYGYASMIEIWRAANATKSNVMMWWWQPDALVEEFTSSDFRFQQIILPTVTDVCFESRIGADDRCADDIAVRRGDPQGACDYEAHALQKIISSNLQRKTLAKPESSRSPGYPFTRSLKVSDLQIQALLKKWMGINEDRYGNDARVAVCSWVIEHMDTLVDFIPPGHPKNLDPTGAFNEGYLYFAMALAAFCFLGLLATSVFVHRYRLTKVFVYAQATLIQIILFGFLLVIMGAFLYAVEPTDSICVARNWLTSLGFSIVLGVVLVKMSTINRIMQNSKRLKRVQVSTKDMVISVGFLVMIDLIFLTTWTVVSPLQAIERLDLPEEFSTTVKVQLICSSEQFIWPYVSAFWNLLLIIVASVLAFQSRGIIPDFNESRSIGTMIYSNFLFLVFRLIVFLLSIIGSIASNIFAVSISFLYIFDTLFATAIYVIPKCIEAKKNSTTYKLRGGSSGSIPPPGFKSNRRSNPNTGRTVNIDHSRQPFGLKGLRNVSMDVNIDSEASVVSNLRGRQPRRRTSFSTNGALSDEPPTSTNSVHEEDWNRRSILSVESSRLNEDSIREESPDDLKDESGPMAMVDNRTRTRNSLSSHDATTTNGIGVMADLQPPPLPPPLSKNSKVVNETEEAVSENESGNNL